MGSRKTIFFAFSIIFVWTCLLYAQGIRQYNPQNVPQKDAPRVPEYIEENEEDSLSRIGLTFGVKAWYSFGDVKVKRSLKFTDQRTKSLGWDTKWDIKSHETYPMDAFYPIFEVEYRPKGAPFFSLQGMFGGNCWLDDTYKEDQREHITYNAPGGLNDWETVRDKWEGDIDGYTFFWGIAPAFRLLHEDEPDAEIQFNLEISTGYFYRKNKFEISHETINRVWEQKGIFYNSGEDWIDLHGDLGVGGETTTYTMEMHAWRCSFNFEALMPYNLSMKGIIGFYPVAYTEAVYRWKYDGLGKGCLLWNTSYNRKQESYEYFTGGLDIDLAFGWSPVRTRSLDINLSIGFKYMLWQCTHPKEKTTYSVDVGETDLNAEKATDSIKNEQWGPYGAVTISF